MRKFYLVLLLTDITLVILLLFFGYYLVALLFFSGLIGLLFFVGKKTSGGYIENVLLRYLQEHSGATKEEIIAHIKRETGNKTNVDLNVLVDELVDSLSRKDKVSIIDDKVIPVE